MGAAAAGLASGAANLFGVGMQSRAASRAAAQQTAAANRANEMQWTMFQQQRADMDPWRQAGVQALYGTGGLFKRKDGGQGMAMNDPAANKAKFMSDFMSKHTGELNSKLQGVPEHLRGKVAAQADAQFRAGAEEAWKNSPESQAQVQGDQYELDSEFTRNFTNDDFVKDPGYDFRMKEGQKALERSNAARSGAGGLSGGQLKALSQYGQDFASNEYGKAYDRFNADRDRRFNRLSSLSGGGQTATSQLGQAGMNYANNAGQNLMGAANAQGAAGIAGANAWGNAFGGMAKAGMDYAAGQQQQNWMDKWMGSQGGGAGKFSKYGSNVVE